jgi:hypothetical protein
MTCMPPAVLPPCVHIAEDGEDLEDPAHARVSGPAASSGRQAEPRLAARLDDADDRPADLSG